MFTLVSNVQMTTTKRLVGLGLLMALALVLAVGFTATPAHADTDTDDACWGQATAVFAQMGEMGEHASSQPTPRLGLHNLAEALFEAGLIPDDSLAALGAFVAGELGLSIEACGT